MFAIYVHDLSPVIIRFTDAIQLRWYGLAYLAGFIVAAVLLEWMSKRKLWVLPPGSAGDFIAAAAIFGVFIGGRLGYMLWYWPRANGWGWITEDPLLLFKVWEGGMASHGGILGLCVFSWFYARKKGVSWLGLGDGLCVVAPLGLMFGRIANFINGELYGRVGQGLAWAVKFPDTLISPGMVESKDFGAAMESAAAADPALVPVFERWMDGELRDGVMFQEMLLSQQENPAVSEAIAPFLEPRHPSQLYEAILEGGLLFAILWTLRLRFPAAPHGLITGVFFVGYAVLRIFGEHFREPDSEMVGALTSGQFLSLFMILAGIGFLVKALRGKNPISAES